MAHTLSHFIPILPFSPCHSSLSTHQRSRLPSLRSRASSISSQMSDQRPRFKDFPYVSDPIKHLMLDLVSMVEMRLESQLLPCTVPQDIEYYENDTGTAHGSIFVRSGVSSSPIDFMFSSWLHCKLPTGGSLNITSLLAYMNDSTDTPQLLIEFIQSSPTSLVILLDLPARRDLVLHPDYLKTFYEETLLEKQRQLLLGIPEIQPYVSPSLYIRCVFSPTAAVIRIDTTATGGEDRLGEIVRDNVSAAAKEVLGIWLDFCELSNRMCNEEADRVVLKKRDSMFKKKSIEIDLGSSLPRMFGQETADRIIRVLLGT
ncbi:red chlorophyll catabolite reductase, chloroplastic [Silene latifolia]|uniref:red chlorophyll catabolite reductase, chloroplastic n=1 Tax=Silene latifolia TaxID=37657 RepID=UPI003D787ECD